MFSYHLTQRDKVLPLFENLKYVRWNIPDLVFLFGIEVEAKLAAYLWFLLPHKMIPLIVFFGVFTCPPQVT